MVRVILTILAATLVDALPVANDTKAPDQVPAAAKHARQSEKFGGQKFGGDAFDADKDDEGFFKTHSSNSDDGYKKLGKFSKKDGDHYGFEEHTVYGKKGNGDKNKNLAYHHTTSYDIDDAKKKTREADDKPTFREWHFESNSKSPTKSSHKVFEDDDSDDEAVDEAFASKKLSGSSGKKIKRSKKPHPDVEVSSNMSPFGPRFQSLPDVSPEGLRRKMSRKTKREKKDPTALSANDDLNYYDDGEDPEFAGIEDGEQEAEGGDYDEYPENEADDYY